MQTVDSNHDEEVLLPPEPEEPLESECCGTGCSPCVFDIYKDRLKRWKEDCGNIKMGTAKVSSKMITKEIISPFEYTKYVIKEIIEDCEFCKILHFQFHDSIGESVEHNSFPVKLGQHIVLRINDKSRQYTVLDVNDDGSFTIIFKIYESGTLTPLVDKLVVGDSVDIRGPFGKVFDYKPDVYNNVIMLAAGSGIAPFCRIIEQVLNNEKDETRIILLFACRNENEVLLLPKLKEWSRAWNFQVQYFISEAANTRKAQNLHYGMIVKCKKIDNTEIKLISEMYNKTNDLFLICGTKSFEKDIVKHLTIFEVERNKIKLF